MEVIVLGGSAAAPNPGDASAGYLVRSGTTALLIDCGSGVLSTLRQHCEPRTLQGVILTHLHSDHLLDLVALRYYLLYAPPGPTALMPLYLPHGGLAYLSRLAAVFAVGNEGVEQFWSAVFACEEYVSAEQVQPEPRQIGDLHVAFAPMQHYVPVWALRLTERATGRSLTFSADTGPCSALPKFAADSDLLLCEATLLQQIGDDPTTWGHLTAAEAGQIATLARVKQLVLTHLWQELGFANYLAAATETYHGPIQLARSGLTITI